MFLAVTGNSWAWVGWGELWTEECVTSVWLSVHCLQETNVRLSFFIKEKKKKLLTICNTPPCRYPEENAGWWGEG